MCGIVGIYSLDGRIIPNLEFRIKKMINSIKYRGPDNVGTYINSKKTFGMSNNQLSIVSPSKKIKLPLSYDNQTFLSFNGEIYNYKYLKNKFNIPNKNYRYLTDTEVLYHILKQEKNDLSELNGVWTFAFYNNLNHSLKLSRDLLGERNLYYYINGNELIFSSEIRPFFFANDLSFKIDNVGLQDMWRYYACRENKSLIQNCLKLRPGTTYSFSYNKLSEFNHSYLKIDKWLDFAKKNNEKKKVDKFLEIFDEETNLRYPNKVKSFSLLSGGIDSSFQNLFLAKKKLNTLYAISSDYNYLEKNNISEINLSKNVSKFINSKHLLAELRENFLKETLKISSNSLETLDPAILNFSKLSSIIRKKNFKVVLASDGPDELLCGYQRDITNYLSKSVNFLKIPYHKIIYQKDFLKKIFLKYEDDTNFFSKPDDRYKHLLKYLDKTQIKSLTNITKSIPEYINIRADKGFMLNSVEIRQPYLSKYVVEYLCAFNFKHRVDHKTKLGKKFIRNLVAKKIKRVSLFPKTGFGQNLISDDKVYNKMKPIILDTINDKKIFDKLNLKPSARQFFLDNKTNRSQKFMIFSLIRSVKNLKK